MQPQDPFQIPEQVPVPPVMEPARPVPSDRTDVAGAGLPSKGLFGRKGAFALIGAGVVFALYLLFGPSDQPAKVDAGNASSATIDTALINQRVNRAVEEQERAAKKVQPVQAAAPVVTVDASKAGYPGAGRGTDVDAEKEAQKQAQIALRQDEIRSATARAAGHFKLESEVQRPQLAPAPATTPSPAEGAAAGELDAAYQQAQAQQTALMKALAGSALEPDKAGTASQESSLDKLVDSQRKAGDQGRKASFPKPALAGHYVRAGTWLRVEGSSEVESGLPCEFIAVVTEDAPDATMSRVGIPKGSRIGVRCAQGWAPGQEKMAISAADLTLPNGQNYSLDGVLVSDITGVAGIRAQVRSRLPTRIGAAVGTGLLSLLAPRGQNGTVSSSANGTTTTTGSVLSETLSQVAQKELDRGRAVEDVGKVESGRTFLIQLRTDLVLQ